jgi:tetratricopeptide (TPR) repeat protein
MIKVQTLRLRGLCASSLLALAACSGTPTDPISVNTPSDGTPLTNEAGTPAATNAPAVHAQDPQGQNPDPQRVQQDRAKLLDSALADAEQSLALRLFEDARNRAAFALELCGVGDDSEKAARARDILRRCSEILGDDPTVSLDSRLNDVVLRDRIRQERERAQVERDLQIGRAHMEQGNFGRAIDSFERAATAMRFSMYAQANDPTRKEAELMLAKAREAKVQADRDAMDRAKAASETEMVRMARDEEIARELRVERILEAANVKFQSGSYLDAVNLVDQALVLDPNNADAMALRDLADRARHATVLDANRERWRSEWNKTFLDLQHANLPQTEVVQFDPARWALVSQRKPSAYTEGDALDTAENRQIQKLLRETVLEHNFASATVEAWASYYGNVTGATFFVTQEVKDMGADKTTLSEFKLTRRPVADALQVIQSQTGVAYQVRDGLVYLVAPGKSSGPIYLRPYNVQDMTQGTKNKPGPDLRLPVPGDDAPLFPEVTDEPAASVVDEGRIQELIKSVIASDKWDGSPFTMNIPAGTGVLLVRADHDTHTQIDSLVRDMRRHVGIQIDVESRFLKVEDTFLEDVGIDLRGLGNQASQGLAGRGLEKKGPRNNAGFDDFGPKQQQNAATPGALGTGTEPGVFFDDGGDGDMMARLENIYDRTLGGRNGGPDNAGGLSLQYAFLDDTEVEIVLRAVSKQERQEEIEAPRLLIYNNTRASMHYLRNIAYIRDFEVEIAQSSAVANPVIGTVHDGVALDVRPVVDSDLQFITMELRPTVMSLQLPIPTFTTTLGVGQPISIQLPEVTMQRVRTTVTMPDGGTIMLGGMRLVERQNMRSTVPLLGSLPGLSWLFSRNGTSVQNRKILILIRANIVLMEEREPETVQLPSGEVLSAK